MSKVVGNKEKGINKHKTFFFLRSIKMDCITNPKKKKSAIEPIKSYSLMK